MECGWRTKFPIVTSANFLRFLLARLHVDSLLDKRTKSKVYSTLEMMRGGFQALDQAYGNAIERVNSQLPEDAALAKRGLSWIINAKRPLTTTELSFALAVEPDTQNLDPDNILDIDDLVSVCAGLVAVDEESNVIRLVHYTTQEYFERIQEDWIPSAQFDIASSCLTYLSFDIFRHSTDNDHENSDWFKQNALVSYTAQYWGQHARIVQNELCERICSFLHNQALVNCAMGVMLSLGSKGRFSSERRTGLHLAAQFGLEIPLAKLLSELGDSITLVIDARDSHDRTPLSLAAEHGHKSVTILLLDNGADIEAKCPGFGTPLMTAAHFGQDQEVSLLLDRGADTNAVDSAGCSALHKASLNGYAKVVKVRLESGADVNADVLEYGTALQSAARGGHHEVTRLLLSEGADLHAKTERRGSAL